MNKKVLIIDNNRDFLETRGERLYAQGYQVYRATSLQQAEQILQQVWIHVLIVDIRMRDDNDDKDVSGLVLAKKDAYRSIPKVILTRYPTFEYVREALGPVVEGLPPAVAFIAKQEGPEVMLHAVEQAFDKHVRINWNLTINWEQLSLHHLVNLIEPALDSTRLLDRAAELEDLFRKLFYDKTQITIGRLFAKEPGQVILEVVAFAEMGSEAQVVVSCGRRPRIKDEAARYEQFAPKEVGIGSTDKEKLVETSHFAATIYTLIGGVPAEMTTFRDFYQSQPVEKIGAALDQLFKITLASWHRKGRFHAEGKPSSELYRDWLELDGDAFARLELEQRIAAISRESLSAGLATINCTPQQLTLRLPDGSSASYRNPAQVQLARNGGAAGALCGLTHGRVDADTVLVDDKPQTWLVDFAHAGSGPLLRDFLLLEMAIKLELLDTTDVYARYALEQRLLDAADLADPIRSDGLAPELQRALATVERIRQLAATLVGRDLEAYVVGLLFCALKTIAAYDPELHYSQRRLVPYAHALLLAAMLHEKLLGPVQAQTHLPDQALRSIWIDEVNKEVWVEGRPIDLTPQDFNILVYLYNNPIQLHSRQDIMKGALGDEYDILEESRFNSALSRLRQKIEPDPDSPKYIITKRGHGYKLMR